MEQRFLSKRVERLLPSLAEWLDNAGIACASVDAQQASPRGAVRILHFSELVHAHHNDILIDYREGVPSLKFAHNGLPTQIAFGPADADFGKALIAEMLRPAAEPACGDSDSAALLTLTRRIARHDATVLILGETGTGKEGMARFVHNNSPRTGKPFIAVNCAALPETMLEAMLFGHQKGSFTGAGTANEGLFRAADGGTLLLDEVAEIPLPLQAKLLRALQEQEVLPVGATHAIPVNVRVVAAANRDLAAEVNEGRFRADLYWRLNVLPVTLRPLHERRLDIRAITAAMLLRHSRNTHSFAWPTTNALDRLMAHDWPGNARELDNVLQRALMLHDGDRIEADDLLIERSIGSSVTRISSLQLADVARTSEADAIRAALEETGGHRVKAARILGISERTLRYRLADLRAAAA